MTDAVLPPRPGPQKNAGTPAGTPDSESDQRPWMLRSLSYGSEVLHARLLLKFWEEGLYSSNYNKLCGLYDGAKEA